MSGCVQHSSPAVIDRYAGVVLANGVRLSLKRLPYHSISVYSYDLLTLLPPLAPSALLRPDALFERKAFRELSLEIKRL